MDKTTKTILIIEDDPQLRAVLGIAVEVKGYEVIEAQTEEAALKITKDPAQSIDYILHYLPGPTQSLISYGEVPVIYRPKGLLDLVDLHTALDQAI